MNNQNTKEIIVLTSNSDSRDGKSEKREYKFDKKRIVIGSILSADLCLEGVGVSPIHAFLEFEKQEGSSEKKSILFDLASDEGVLVNGERCVTRTLKNGDRIQIGNHELVFSLKHWTNTKQESSIREAEGRTLFLNPKEDLKPLLLEDEREIEEIFDYRPTVNHAMEIVMSWFGTILNSEHFLKEKKIFLGNHRGSHFPAPLVLSSKKYEILTKSQDGFLLNINHDMGGVVYKKGEMKPLSDYFSTNSVFLEKNDFAKILLGEIEFCFRFTAAPPCLKHRRLFERDSFFNRIFISSLLLTSLALVSILRMSPVINVDPESIPDRIATILYDPEKINKIVHLTDALPQHTLPDRSIKPAHPIETVKKKEPVVHHKANLAPVAKEGAKIRTKEPGNKLAPPPSTSVAGVEFLKGAGGKIENLLEGSIKELSHSQNSLKITGNFAPQTEGKGFSTGGGTYENKLGGWGKKGTGIGRVSTGKAASGTGIVGDQVRLSINLNGPEEAIVLGAIDRNAVAEAILSHRDEFRYCYEKEINAENANLSGQIGTRFVIGASGRVTQAGIESSSLKNTYVENCVLAVLKRIHFPAPKGGGTVEVRFPFKFNTSQKVH